MAQTLTTLLAGAFYLALSGDQLVLIDDEPQTRELLLGRTFARTLH